MARKAQTRGRNEGTVYKDVRKDEDGKEVWNGRWRAQYMAPVVGGKFQRKSISGKSRKEVTDKLRDVLGQLDHGSYLMPSKETVCDYLKYWLDTAAKPRVKPATYVSYEVIVRVHLADDTGGLGNIRLQELSSMDIEAYKLRKLKTRSARSVAYQLTILSAALDQAVEWGLLQRNAAKSVNKPRVPKPKTARFSTEDATRFIASLRGDRLEALFLVALGTGLRRGELLGLHWKDVDMERGVLRVREALLRLNHKLTMQETKNSRTRLVKLPAFALGALHTHLANQEAERSRSADWQDNGLVFPSSRGTPMEPRNLNRHFDVLLKRAGLEHYRVHDLRHSFASMMEAQGVPLKTLSTMLGHSTIAITADLYVHPYESTMDDAAERLNNLLG